MPGSSGKVYAFNQASGLLQWTSTAAAGTVVLSAVVDVPSGEVYFTTVDERLIALDANGATLWTFTASAPLVTGTPVISSSGVVYVGGLDMKMYAVVGRTSEVATWDAAGGGEVRGAAAVDGVGRVYFGACGAVVAANPDGSRVWSYALGASCVQGRSLLDAQDNSTFCGVGGGGRGEKKRERGREGERFSLWFGKW